MKSKLNIFLAVMMFASIGSISSAYGQGVQIKKNICSISMSGNRRCPLETTPLESILTPR